MTDMIENYLGFIQEHPRVFLVFNIIAFVLMGSDKSRARQQQFRISEICLLIFGFLGPLGVWTGMVIFNHKTRKLWFQFLMFGCTALNFCFQAYIFSQFAIN